MKRVFADTYYFFALLNRNERHHLDAREFADTFRGQLVTTGWILTELGDGMAQPRWRHLFISLYQELIAIPHIRVISCSDKLLSAGIQFYGSRPDKSWSLTDCISLVIMQREDIAEALTGDRHFEQAGFTVLFN
jgi:predicted nucleic acid-binding protein